MKAKILIAGGEGFIGKNLQGVLNSHDIKFDVVDLKSGNDICDADVSQYEVIVLLAANLGQDMDMFQDNLRICKWAMRQTAHIIYTSSAAVYADDTEPHVETERPAPPTLYGRSKLLGEQLISKGSQHYTILRLANVCGNGDGNGAIDIFKRGGNKIYGVGDNVRDYVDVRIVANAIKSIALDPDKFNLETYNISTGVPMTTKQAFYEFGHGQPEYLPERGFDVKYSVLNNRKAKRSGLIDAN